MSPVKSKFLLPAIFIAVFAVSRIPGLLPPNFSVAYAFAFCAGVYFRGARGVVAAAGVMLATDLGLNILLPAHGETSGARQSGQPAFNYAAYAALILLGRRFKPQIVVAQPAWRRAAGRDFVLSHHQHRVVALQSVRQSGIRQNPRRLDHALTKGHRRLSPDVGIFPQHPLERRHFHRAVCRRRQSSPPNRPPTKPPARANRKRKAKRRAAASRNRRRQKRDE